jgi:RimJ/RimL family protein N-acetyltransferase
MKKINAVDIDKHCSNKYGFIETDRLIIRERTKDDCEPTVAGLSQYDVAKYLSSVPFPYTEADADDYFENKCKNANTAENMQFVITLKDTGEVIGGTGAELKKAGKYSGGIWINSKYHGRGYGTEAYKALAEFLFDVCGAEIIQSGYYCDNEKSKKMHEKIGFVKTDKIEDHFCPARKEYVKCIITELTRKDFR